MNKLDYLAQKEEELRKLNEQLDNKKKVLMDNQAEAQKEQDEQIVEQKGKDLFSNNNWILNQITEGANDEPEYNKDQFVEASPSNQKDLDLK